MISRVAFFEFVFSHVPAARGAGRTINGPTATILMTTTMPLKKEWQDLAKMPCRDALEARAHPARMAVLKGGHMFLVFFFLCVFFVFQFGAVFLAICYILEPKSLICMPFSCILELKSLICFWPLAFGFWLLASGFWLLAVAVGFGFWLGLVL